METEGLRSQPPSTMVLAGVKVSDPQEYSAALALQFVKVEDFLGY